MTVIKSYLNLQTITHDMKVFKAILFKDEFPVFNTIAFDGGNRGEVYHDNSEWWFAYLTPGIHGTFDCIPANQLPNLFWLKEIELPSEEEIKSYSHTVTDTDEIIKRKGIVIGASFILSKLNYGSERQGEG